MAELAQPQDEPEPLLVTTETKTGEESGRWGESGLVCLQIGAGHSGQKREPLARPHSQGLMEDLPHLAYERDLSRLLY